jgi:hypothetical protein
MWPGDPRGLRRLGYGDSPFEFIASRKDIGLSTTGTLAASARAQNRRETVSTPEVRRGPLPFRIRLLPATTASSTIDLLCQRTAVSTSHDGRCVALARVSDVFDVLSSKGRRTGAGRSFGMVAVELGNI